ncbi:MAG: antirestriction protein ArdA, partial [Enterococcus lemanii]
MSDLKIEIYVANLAQYNDGNIVELPISFSEIAKKCQLSPSEEKWIILDYEAPFKIHEYDSIGRLNTIANDLSGVSNE